MRFCGPGASKNNPYKDHISARTMAVATGFRTQTNALYADLLL